MTLNVCPADTVSAPVERVWGLLMRPADYGRFFDLNVERVEPAGLAKPGQRIAGWTRELGKRWNIEGEIEDVNTERHQLRFRMSLPFGVIGINRIGAQAIDATHCLLRFD